jgi:hypothetical protein
MCSLDGGLDLRGRVLACGTLNLPIGGSILDLPKVSGLVEGQPEQPRPLILVKWDNIDHTSGGFLFAAGYLEA